METAFAQSVLRRPSGLACYQSDHFRECYSDECVSCSACTLAMALKFTCNSSDQGGPHTSGGRAGRAGPGESAGRPSHCKLSTDRRLCQTSLTALQLPDVISIHDMHVWILSQSYVHCISCSKIFTRGAGSFWRHCTFASRLGRRSSSGSARSSPCSTASPHMA